MITLTHPLHGMKHCYMEGEAVADEKNGWTRVDPDAAAQVESEAQVPDDASDDADEGEAVADEQMAQPADTKKKRGRPAKA